MVVLAVSFYPSRRGANSHIWVGHRVGWLAQEGMLRDTARNEPYRLALEKALQKMQGATVMER